jgi:hypothetical protein
MAYRNECHFLKIVDDDGNPTTGPDLTDSTPDEPRTSVSSSTGGQAWLGEQQLPTRERSAGLSPGFQMPPGPYVTTGAIPMHGSSSGAMSGFVSENGESNDTSTSPDGQSNRPTPNSSTASEQRNTLLPGSLAAGSGRNSFEASPAASHHNLAGQTDMDRGVEAYFADPSSGFGMSTGLTPMMTGETPGGSADFAVPPGWEMQGQTAGMAPVSDGVLRTIMQMGPIETMDIGWDSNQ